KLVGSETQNIIESFTQLIEYPEYYEKMANIENPYGIGNASKIIVETLLKNR
ncbi:UDP-N-acetylglucosamine 2-epimerase (non-hydrolyzing), partial [Klebsiella pneumoniae]